MLWNWNTIDACFISRSWHITSKAMFAGSCIGVVLLVIALEALRRAGKEYDRYLIAQYKKKSLSSPITSSVVPNNNSDASSNQDLFKQTSPIARAALTCAAAGEPQVFRPSVAQQAIRALLQMLQFAVAYFVMLLAMYYNGYIIICIFLGEYIGYFIFGWETFIVQHGGRDRMQQNATVCCG